MATEAAVPAATTAENGAATAPAAAPAAATPAAAAAATAPATTGAAKAAPAAAAPASAEGAAAPSAENGNGTAGATAAAANSGYSTTSLYVGDLDIAVTEAQLYDLFSQVGPVVSVRVLRDMVTRRSLGYAYVNYSNAADASRAIELLNFMSLNNRPIRIMFSQRDPSTRRSGSGNIFIKNLDRTIDNKQLNDTFAQFGTILSCKIATDNTGASKGYGFVQFEADESAKSAIEQVNGMSLAGKQVFVGPFVRRSDRDSTQTTFTNVYVKNLSEETTEANLEEAFGVYGQITSASLSIDESGKSKCFGFINFEEPECAAKAVEELDGKQDGERQWVVCRAQKKSEREAELKTKFEKERKERLEKYQGANLYLKNLDDTVDDEKLREIFAECGTITSCKVMKDALGASRGSGFVAFSTPEEATRAVTEMNGKMVNNKPLYVALAQRKEERRARLQQQFQQRIVSGGMPAGLPYGMPPGPGVPGGQAMYFGQPPAGLLPPQAHGYGFPGQPMMPAGMQPRPGLPQYFVPMMQRQGQGQRGGNRRGQGQAQPARQQQVRYPPNARGAPPMAVMQGGMMLPNDAMAVPGSGMAGGQDLQQLQQQQQEQQQQQQNGASQLASQLANASPDEQRMLLGETLYPMIEAMEPQNAAKITGMLLEMDQSEVLHLIESPESLSSKVAEAISVLKAAAAPQPPDLSGMTISGE